MKKILFLIYLFSLTLLLSTVLISITLPFTDSYKEAKIRFEEVKEKLPAHDPQMTKYYKVGYQYGFSIEREDWLILTLIIVSFFLSSLTLWLLKQLKKRSKTDENFFGDVIANVFSHIILFSLLLFLKRSSKQLSYFFDLPTKIKYLAVAAYFLVFAAMGILFNISNSGLSFQFELLFYIVYFYPPLLVYLTLFSSKFRKNYQNKLFYISLSILILQLLVGYYLGFKEAETGLDGNALLAAVDQKYNFTTISTALIIVTAFSVYIELMKNSILRKRNLEYEIKLAKNLQKELIPTLDLNISHFELYGRSIAAESVGGDYIDFIELNDNRYAIKVADVSGHNIASGLLMSMLKTAFRTELKYMRSLDDLAGSLNQTIYENKNKSMFISFLTGIINTKSREIEIINAGHPPLIHYDSVKNKIFDYRTGDVALGLKRDHSFKKRSFYYNADDIIVLYSDGIMEAVNEHNKELGVNGIKHELMKVKEFSAEKIYESIISKVESFNHSPNLKDDVTLLVVKFK